MSKNRSTGSTTYSALSASSRQTTSSIQETSAKIYFVELQKYLSFILAKGTIYIKEREKYIKLACIEASEGVPPTRSTARQKLSRLNNLQFHELATDVYDELIRRNSDNHRKTLKKQACISSELFFRIIFTSPRRLPPKTKPSKTKVGNLAKFKV